tara:strand:- start:55 stop:219 length:165 start_codon:yes stop_codon:yes gene_type:complete
MDALPVNLMGINYKNIEILSDGLYKIQEYLKPILKESERPKKENKRISISVSVI